MQEIEHITRDRSCGNLVSDVSQLPNYTVVHVPQQKVDISR